MIAGKQVVATVASGSHAGKLDYTFTSFAQNPGLELHAFIVDHHLPERQLPGIIYHLKEPDPAFSNPMRDMYYRRWSFIDELDAEFALVVDNGDVLCLQPMPSIPELLRGASVAACVEHDGGRYLAGQRYVSCYLNAGVTLWNVPKSREMRAEIVQRGRTRFRNIDDQLSLNEVVQTRYWDQLCILPSQFNYRSYIHEGRKGWPVVNTLDGVVLYHNSFCIDAAKKLLPVNAKAALPELEPDGRPLTTKEQFWRRLDQRGEPHFMNPSYFRDTIDLRNGGIRGIWRAFAAFFGKTKSDNKTKYREQN